MSKIITVLLEVVIFTAIIGTIAVSVTTVTNVTGADNSRFLKNLVLAFPSYCSA